MTKLIWNQLDQLKYESGVSHGVLYPSAGPGVVWNGLTDVNESFVGGDLTSFYFDGTKHLDILSSRFFQATIAAFSSPIEFDVCVGDKVLAPGLMMTGQPKPRFGFSYRTNVNDVDYKIHLVYNATASLSKRGGQTRSGTVSPSTLEWSIDAVPVPSNTYKPSAHYIIDSTKTPASTLSAIESILYGYTDAPRLLLPFELTNLSLLRFIVVVSNPASLPSNIQDGDVVFSTSNNEVYSYNDAASPDVRQVIVISGNSLSLLPSTAVTGDIVYDQTTGILYRLGG